MAKYLILSAWETYRSDGLRVLMEQVLRYLTLYGSPFKIARYWLLRTFGNPLQLVRVQGSVMRLDLRDRGIHADLFINGIREPQATKHLQSIIKPDWTMVDIGANIGYYVLMEARRAKMVYAIEPGPENFKNLTHNVGVNGNLNVRSFQLAVGDHEGVVGFTLAKASNWNKVAADGKGDIEVQMTTLDKFLGGKKVDFVRMDVEGYEMAILRGMDRTLRESRPDMFIEVHRDMLREFGSSQLEFMELLARHGYCVSKSFISARPGLEGRIVDLLADPVSRREITERGIASHFFFTAEERWN
ncbi:MAG: FkbM family methyltransferase [Dehalococcoidia bacterium]|nr:FkbM family methyltransferase [Dehalococcoidia bacterium]